jgi:hypothetical protein
LEKILAWMSARFASDPMCPLTSHGTQLKLIRTPDIKTKQ